MPRRSKSPAKAPPAGGAASKHVAALDKHTAALNAHAKAMTAAAGAQHALTVALNKNTKALATVHSTLQRIADAQSCVSKWLRDNKGASEVESRTYSKNVTDFHFNGPPEMDQFVAGVANCLKAKGYAYNPDPSPTSPGWNHLIAQLLNGTLADVVSWFVTHTA